LTKKEARKGAFLSAAKDEMETHKSRREVELVGGQS